MRGFSLLIFATRFYPSYQALRHEVAGSGVRVTCIQPGDVRTPLISISTDQEVGRVLYLQYAMFDYLNNSVSNVFLDSIEV